MSLTTPEKFELFDKKRIITPVGDIDHETVEYFYECLVEKLVFEDEDNMPDIRVLITSNGGGTRASLQIYDMLRVYPGHVTGTVVANARSGAVTVLQGCTERVSMKHATLLIHNPLRDNVRITLDQLNNWKKCEKRFTAMRDQMQVGQLEMLELFVQRSGSSQEVIEAQLLKDELMTPEEAKQIGLIDTII